MRDVIASVLLVVLLACAWACYVVVSSYGGVSRILEGTLFLGFPAAAAAGATALLSPLLASRLGWPRLPAYLLLGVLCGLVVGLTNVVALKSDLSLSAPLVAWQLARFALLGVALGALVLGVSRLMGRNARGA